MRVRGGWCCSKATQRVYGKVEVGTLVAAPLLPRALYTAASPRLKASTPAWPSAQRRTLDHASASMYMVSGADWTGRQFYEATSIRAGLGPANICKPLVWCPLEQKCLFSKNCKDSAWKQSFVLTGMHPALVPHLFHPAQGRRIMWSSPIWKSRLQCCELKRAHLFLLP